MLQSLLQVPQNARGQYTIFAGQAADFAHAVFVSPMEGEVRIAGAELRVQHNSLFVAFRTTGRQIHSQALYNKTLNPSTWKKLSSGCFTAVRSRNMVPIRVEALEKLLATVEAIPRVTANHCDPLAYPQVW